MQDILPFEVKAKLDGGEPLVLIDLRSARDYAQGHIEGAISIPEEELAGTSLEFPLDSQIVVYSACNT